MSAPKVQLYVLLTVAIAINVLCALVFTLLLDVMDPALLRQVAVMFHLLLLLLAVAGVADTVAAEAGEAVAKAAKAGGKEASSEIRRATNSVETARVVKNASRLMP